MLINQEIKGKLRKHKTFARVTLDDQIYNKNTGKHFLTLYIARKRLLVSCSNPI